MQNPVPGRKHQDIRFSILFIFLVFIICSCEYEPNDVYYRDADKNKPSPVIQTIRLNLDEDTIYLYSDKPIHFEFKSNDQEIKRVSLSLDDSYEMYINSDSGTFSLNYENLTAGFHKLRMEVFTATGTGSIADIIGSEEYVETKTWTLVVARDYNPQVRAVIKNGLLEVSWDQCIATDLKEYIIYRSDNWMMQTETKRTTSTHFSDSSYVGEGTIYIVKVLTRDSILFNWGHVEVLRDFPEIKLTVTKTNDCIINWTKTKFYNAVDSFQVKQSISYLNNQVVNLDYHDTTYQITGALFGDYIRISLKLVPLEKNANYYHSYYNKYISELEFNHGFQFKSPEEYFISYIKPVNQDEFIYVSNLDSLFRYSISQERITGKLGYLPVGCSKAVFTFMQSSASGKYLNSYVGCNEELMLTDTRNLSNYGIFSINDLKSYGYPPVKLSDVQTGIFSAGIGGFYVYSFRDRKILAHYPHYYNTHTARMSINGDYIFINDGDSLRLLEFKNSAFRDIWTYSSYAGYTTSIEFNPIDNSQLVMWDGSTLSVKYCNTFATAREFSIDDQYLLNIDYYNDEMLTYNNGHLYIRSFIDGTLLKDIPVNIVPNPGGSQTCYLMNRTIVGLQGILYFVN